MLTSAFWRSTLMPIGWCQICNYMEVKGNSSYPPTPLNASIVKLQYHINSIKLIQTEITHRIHHQVRMEHYDNAPSVLSPPADSDERRIDFVDQSHWSTQCSKDLRLKSVTFQGRVVLQLTKTWTDRHLKNCLQGYHSPDRKNCRQRMEQMHT